MNKQSISALLLIAFFSVPLPRVTAGELKTAPNPVAEMNLSAARVEWVPAVDAKSWVLTVSGPGDFLLRRQFEAGKTPFLALIDSEEDRLADGSYAWELQGLTEREAGTENPSTPPRRKTGAQAPREQQLRLSGRFSIRDGSFVATPPNAGAETPEPPLHNFIAKDSILTGKFVNDGNACIGDECNSLSNADFSALKLRSPEPDLLFDDVGIPCEGPGCPSGEPHDWAVSINQSDIDQFAIKDYVDGALHSTPFTLMGNAPDNSLFVDASGRVGVGTSTPGVRLDIRANSSGAAAGNVQNASATGYSGFTYANNSGIVISFLGVDNANANTRLNSNGSYPIVILTNSAERMRVTAAGNVGIGTANPSQALHVKGRGSGDGVIVERGGLTQDTEIKFANENNYAVWTMHFDGNSPEDLFIFPVHNSKDLILQADETGTAFGNVGIGTTNPTSRLHVNGDVRVSGGSFIDDGVTLNAPDYVFEPSYKLMPLKELREFVTQEKHLPNVPNAREVKEGGLNLSQFQMRLLEKVEELTLYTLTQDQRLTSQQGELLRIRELNTLLQQRLAALEKARSAEEPE